MIAIGKGLLRHHFHGTYGATIVLVFNSEYEAKQVLPKLMCFDSERIWRCHPVNKDTLVWTGNSDQVADCKEVLASFGADRDKIDSVKKSIDYGEPFEVRMEIIAPEQTKLF